MAAQIPKLVVHATFLSRNKIGDPPDVRFFKIYAILIFCQSTKEHRATQSLNCWYRRSHRRGLWTIGIWAPQKNPKKLRYKPSQSFLWLFHKKLTLTLGSCFQNFWACKFPRKFKWFQLIELCWHKKPENRPKLKDIRKVVENTFASA